MADGIQWVERISKVAALAFFIWSTTICTDKDKSLKCTRQDNRRQAPKTESSPADIPDQISDIHHCSSQPC